MVRLADGLIAAPRNLDISTVQDQELAPTFHFHIRQYLSRRAADWAALGFKETLVDWPALNARSKFWGDDQRAAWKNWEEVADPRNKPGGRQGVDERIMLRELLRRVDMMVILENRLDAIVRLHTPLPPARIGYPDEPGLIARLRNESQYGPNAGLTEVLIPAGYVTTAYDAEFTLSADGKKYVGKASTKPTQLAAPGLPLLARVPCGAGQGRRRAEDRRRVRGGDATPRSSPGLRAGRRNRWCQQVTSAAVTSSAALRGDEHCCDTARLRDVFSVAMAFNSPSCGLRREVKYRAARHRSARHRAMPSSPAAIAASSPEPA